MLAIAIAFFFLLFSYMMRASKLGFKLVFGQITSSSFGAIIGLYLILVVKYFFLNSFQDVVLQKFK